MYKVIDPKVCDFLVQASKNLFNASQSGDPDLVESVLVNLKAVTDSYIHALHEGKHNETY